MQTDQDCDFRARNYQIELVETALKKNTIIYLPTGTGKTLIAVMVLRELSGPLQKPISQGGKISVMLANTHALVDQHYRYFQRFTACDVLEHYGKKNANAWKEAMWKKQLDNHQILVTTPVIFLHIVQNSILSLNDVNLLIFDECHRAVNKHPMKRVMKNYRALKEPPRILGLTATLLNGNCTTPHIIEELDILETTLHSKIATTELQRIVEFSANPKEIFKAYAEDEPLAVVSDATQRLEVLCNTLAVIRPKSKTLRDLINLIKDIILHIEMFGIIGGRIAVVLHIDELQANIRNCHDYKMCILYDMVLTTLRIAKKMFEKATEHYDNSTWFLKFSSHRVHVLLNILREYLINSLDICGIIFVKRRLTAIILFHILALLRLIDSKFIDIRPNFILGCSGNSYNYCLESKLSNKMSKMNRFYNKEINLLVASNVLEEGVDVPICNLVINFDFPVDYRAYIQSKGRARHCSSFYYIMVNINMYDEFKKAYSEYKTVEKIVNNHLTNRNLSDGEDNFVESVEKDLGSKNQTCDNNGSNYLHKSNQVESIKAPHKQIEELAKKVAALNACNILQQTAELKDTLMLTRHDEIDANENSEKPNARNIIEHKLYSRKIADVCTGKVEPSKSVYLHIIDITPNFVINIYNFGQSVMNQMYFVPFSYGIVTAQPLPQLCEFSLYLPAGEISVNFKVNQDTLNLTAQQIVSIKRFHYVIFKEVLELLKTYVLFNNDEVGEILLVVPIQRKKNDCVVDFNVVYENQKIGFNEQENGETDLGERYLGKTVTVSSANAKYYVICICANVFPDLEEGETVADNSRQDDYINYGNGYQKPVLLVTKLPEQINYLKPCSDKHTLTENLNYLVPEACRVQSFPSALRVHANLLPSILYRIITLLQTDELRRKIALETGWGIINLKEDEKWLPLVSDEHLSNYTIDEPSKLVSQEMMLKEPEKTMKTMIGGTSLRLKVQEELQTTEEKLSTICTGITRNYDGFMLNDINGISEENEEVDTASTSDVNSPAFVTKNIELLKNTKNCKGPELREVFTALATSKSNDVVNLERLEILGDTFLKFAISIFINLKYPDYDEGKSSILRSDTVSNKNLYHVGVTKQLNGYLQTFNCDVLSEWKPPCFRIPKQLSEKVIEKHLPTNFLKHFHFSPEEQFSGVLDLQTVHHIKECNEKCNKEKYNKNAHYSMLHSLELLIITNKTIADSVEALIGVYFQSGGFTAGLILLQWLDIIPKSEDVENLLCVLPKNPLSTPNCTINDIDSHIPQWGIIEERLGYHFKNRAYLLQALTHSSYTPNCLTTCYQKLEFLGDAILDLIITCYIYESCGNLNPGQLTDLRSALVNNLTFASLATRHGFHKFILYSNDKLRESINNFVRLQEQKNFVITDGTFILFEEDNLYVAQQTDAPKILGDIFESLAAAVYLDSGMNLEVVWEVFYRIMWKEIELFCHKVPKNAVRVLNETVNANPEYGKPVVVATGGTTMALEFTLNGRRTTVYGFGENKCYAKKAAAKMALHLLQK